MIRTAPEQLVRLRPCSRQVAGALAEAAEQKQFLASLLLPDRFQELTPLHPDGAQHDRYIHHLLLLLLPLLAARYPRQWRQGVVPGAAAQMHVLKAELVERAPVVHDERGYL